MSWLLAKSSRFNGRPEIDPQDKKEFTRPIRSSRILLGGVFDRTLSCSCSRWRMIMEFRVNGALVRLIRGDITQQDTTAIVNAANSSLMGGGGVDGAIHRAGGPQILEECKKIRQERGPCPPGEAVITTGGRLKARYVIHTVGPIWQGGDRGEDKILASAYRNSLRLAKEHGIRTIAFPSISTGAYRFPIERAARIALTIVKEFLAAEDGFDEVRFVLFSDADLRVYEEAAIAE